MGKRTLDRENVAAVAIILFVALLVYYPVLLPGRVLLPADLLLITPPWAQQSAQLSPEFTHVLRRTWDPLFQFYPSRKFLAQSFSEGWIPLWNPHSFSGTPFAADGQSAVFYPPNWLYAALPLPFAFGAVAFLHTFFTGIFFYAYGRRVGWSAAGSTAGAVAWMLCGVQVGWQMWQVVDDTLCWLPLCLYYWEGLRQNSTARDLVGLSFAIALTVLAGHLQFAFYVLLTTASYAFYRPIASDEHRYWLTLKYLVRAFAFGIGLAAVQWLASADLLRLGVRGYAPISQLLPSALDPTQVGLLVMPNLFGAERDYLNHPFIVGEFYEKVLYCGASALVFAAFALRLRRAADLSRFWTGLAVFALLMGFGTPLYALFYYSVPLYKSFHGLSRIFVLFDFAVAALAAQGITLLSYENVSSRIQAAKLSTVIVALSMIIAYRIGILQNGQSVAALLTHNWLGYGLQQLGIALVLAVVAALLIFRATAKTVWLASILVCADMLYFAVGFNPGSASNLLYPPTTETSFVTTNLRGSPTDRVLCVSDGTRDRPQSRITPNGAMSLGWNDVSGSDPLLLSRYNAFIGLVNTTDTGQSNPAGQGMIADSGNPALNMLDVRWIVAPRILTVPSYRLAYSGAVNIYENMNALGASWLVRPSAAFTVGSSIEEQKQLLTGSIKPSLMEVEPSASQVGPNRIVITANPDTSSLLVVSQIYCPGWTVTINGKRGDVVPIDGLLMGVQAPAGKDVVDLNYQPTSVRLGLYISLLSLLLIACFLRRTRSA